METKDETSVRYLKAISAIMKRYQSKNGTIRTAEQKADIKSDLIDYFIHERDESTFEIAVATANMIIRPFEAENPELAEKMRNIVLKSEVQIRYKDLLHAKLLHCVECSKVTTAMEAARRNFNAGACAYCGGSLEAYDG